MKVLIIESRLSGLVFKWLDRNVGNLTKTATANYDNYYNSDGDILFSYHLTHNSILVSQERIWEYLEQLFALNYNEAKSLLKKWVETRFGLNVTSVAPMWD